MDRITTSHVEAFRAEQALPKNEEATTFEHFVNFCIIADLHDEEFDIHDVHTGGGADLGIDGLAIIVNGALVTTIDEMNDLRATNSYLDVRFMFMQAKSGTSFSGESMASFGDGVLDFFSDKPSLPHSEKIAQLRELMTWLYDHSVDFRQGKPSCELSFVTTGRWVEDAHLTAKMNRVESNLLDLNLFSRVTFRALGASEIQASWTRSRNAASVEFTFQNKVTMPDIAGISESYVGVLPLGEFLKVVADDESGTIRKNIFYDNVRDFQGSNAVNSEMSKSLQSQAGQDRFAVLNNGVTLVARTLRNTGNRFFVADYQIVNGCQTSHVLYNNRESLPVGLSVPFKVIATNDEEVINSIITATNRQTQVTDEDLFALSTFQKQLEAYMVAFDDKQKLYYERRSRQYATSTIEKVRIITKTLEMRAFSAMFLDEPRRAANYYSELKPMVGKSIFNADHKMEPYYTSAFAYYKLEFLFRNGQIPVSYKPARFHLLMAVRYIIAGKDAPSLMANKMESYAKKINDVLWSDQKAVDIFKQACAAVDAVQDGAELTRDSVKVQSFSEALQKQLQPA